MATSGPADVGRVPRGAAGRAARAATLSLVLARLAGILDALFWTVAVLVAKAENHTPVPLGFRIAGIAGVVLAVAAAALAGAILLPRGGDRRGSPVRRTARKAMWTAIAAFAVSPVGLYLAVMALVAVSGGR